MLHGVPDVPGDGPQDGRLVIVTGRVNDSVDVPAIERVLGVDIPEGLIRALELGSQDLSLLADSVVVPSG